MICVNLKLSHVTVYEFFSSQQGSEVGHILKLKGTDQA